MKLKALEGIDEAMEIVSDQRACFGACQNRLNHAQKNADNAEENLQA